MISVAQARAAVLDLVEPLDAEQVALRDAAGRIMAAPATARLTQPPFSASAMDGYWVNGCDHTPGAQLHVIGESAAGHRFAAPVAQGQAIRIFTGAPVPAEGGVVVIQEDITVEGQQITLPAQLSAKDNIRARGQDFTEGHAFQPAHPLSARDLGLLAAMNVAHVTVHRRPVVAIIATGDELVMPDEAPGPDQIIASNSFILAALIEAAGGQARMLPIAADDRESLRMVFDLAKGADLIVTSGGASVGAHDIVGDVAAELGLERRFWKIAMRPGKPLMAGKLGDAAMLGLPGNPVSAAVCAELFLKPMLAKMLGQRHDYRPEQAILGCDLGPAGPRTHFMRATLRPTPQGPEIMPFDNQDSAMLSVLAQADALLIREKDDGPARAGTKVQFLPLN